MSSGNVTRQTVLRYIIENCGCTQKQIKEDTGLNQGYVSRCVRQFVDLGIVVEGVHGHNLKQLTFFNVLPLQVKTAVVKKLAVPKPTKLEKLKAKKKSFWSSIMG